jgi:hypothetical protein
MEDTIGVRLQLQPATGSGAALCRWLRTSSRRYHRPTGQIHLPERTQEWIKLGGNVRRRRRIGAFAETRAASVLFCSGRSAPAAARGDQCRGHGVLQPLGGACRDPFADPCCARRSRSRQIGAQKARSGRCQGGFGNGLRAKRSKSGAISFNPLGMEEPDAIAPVSVSAQSQQRSPKRRRNRLAGEDLNSHDSLAFPKREIARAATPRLRADLISSARP